MWYFATGVGVGFVIGVVTYCYWFIEMWMDDKGAMIIVFLTVFGIGVSVGFMPAAMVMDTVRNKAVYNHRAEYYLDKDHKEKLRWLTPCGEK